VAAALAANAIEIQQQIKIIDVEKYRTRVSFIQEDLRRSTGVLSNHHNDRAERGNTFRRLIFANKIVSDDYRAFTANRVFSE